MVLRALFFSVVVVFFSLGAFANPALTCIGKGNTPSSDKFYANKINNLIEESQRIEDTIASLEKRLPAIERELDDYKTNKIPRLFREFAQNPNIATHPTLKVTFQELKSFFYKHEKQHADMLIANKNAEREFKTEFIRIYNQKVKALESFELGNRLIAEKIAEAHKKFSEEFPRIDDRYRRLEESFRDRRLELSNELRERTGPSFLRRPLTRQQIAAERRKHQTALAQLEEEKKAQLTPLKRQRDEYIQNYRKTIDLFQAQIKRGRELHNNLMKELDAESDLNTREYQEALRQNRARFNSQVEQDNKNFDSAMRNVLDILMKDNNPEVRRFAQSDGILASIKRDKDAIDALIQERSEIHPRLENLKKEREKYKFITAWWNEQGRRNEQVATEAGTCVGCEESTKNPIAEMLRPKTPHLKLACVEASIRGKAAYNTGIKCEDSNKSAGTSTDICVTQRMADYTQWALNKAFDCLSTPDMTIDPQVVFRKLNNESTFKFFYSYQGGHGLMQTVRIAQNEVLGLDAGGRSSGRRHLAQIMNSNKESCQIYKSIIDFEKEAKLDQLARRKDTAGLNRLKAEYPQHNRRLFDEGQPCNFLSLEEGIHRNILNGLGLFAFYKREAQSDLIEFFGPSITKNPQFKQIRDTLSLVYYGPQGRGGGKQLFASQVVNEVKARYRDLTKVPADAFESILARHVPYIRAIRRSEGAVNSQAQEDDLQCVE